MNTLGLAEAVSKASTVDEAWGALQRAFKGLGFSSARYGFSTSPDLAAVSSNLFMVGDFGGGEFEETYAKERLVEIDPTVIHCMTATHAVTWREMDQTLDLSASTKRERRFYELSLDCGFINGVTIPLRDQNAFSRGGLSLQADPYENPKDFEKFIAEKMPTLRQMAEVFHCNLHRPLLLDEGELLSPREKECLLWSIYGLQTQQIAARIGTHPKTVEKQLSSARSRLKARTTTQAAIKAVLLGLIEP